MPFAFTTLVAETLALQYNIPETPHHGQGLPCTLLSPHCSHCRKQPTLQWAVGCQEGDTGAEMSGGMKERNVGGNPVWRISRAV